MHRRTWKKGEQRVAEFFNAKRNSLSGINSKLSSSDSTHKILYIECKHGKKFLNEKLWLDTLKKAKEENKTPLVVSQKLHNNEPIIMCRLKDIKKIAVEVKDE